MPALGTRTADARDRSFRLLGLGLSLLFIGAIGTAFSSPADAKDWTPRIQATRRAQVYWESLMRSADAELRSLKKTKKAAQRKLDKTEARLERAVAKRVAAKRDLRDLKADLAEMRDLAQKDGPDLQPPPDVVAALLTLASPSLAVPLGASPYAAPDTVETVADVPETAEVRTVADGRELAKLERKVKQAKRSFKQAKRKARRNARNARSARVRVTSLKAARNGAFARRESAERNLGGWILAMTKYGRIRATKKSDARPGANSSFAWPVRGRISQYYHRGHDGLDIVRYRSAPVRTMAFGVVTYVGWNPWDQHGRAFMIVVTHAGGYETLYGHLLPRRIVRVGQEVKKGEVIGYMGSTGNSTGPHLHLEVRRGRTTLNPLGVL